MSDRVWSFTKIMLSIFEAAAFALDVYRDVNRPALPNGWRLYLDYTPEEHDRDYFGACYINTITFPGAPEILTRVVFAHRGTIFKFGDFVSDFILALGDVPNQFLYAKKFYDLAVLKLKNDFPSESGEIEQIAVQSGHSLGAVISEIMCVATAGSNSLPITTCYSFESPGSKPIIENMVKEGSLLPLNALQIAAQSCCITQTHYDFVNTCNEQVVSSVNTLNIPFNYNVLAGPVKIVPKEYLLNIYYIIGYSFLDQHKIQHIYDYLSQGGEIGLTAWPFGFENGYESYRSYTKLKYYWDGYIKICWDTHPEIQAAYQGDYSKYNDYFISEYLSDSVDLHAQTQTLLLNKFGVFHNKLTPEGFVLIEHEDAKTDQNFRISEEESSSWTLLTRNN